MTELLCRLCMLDGTSGDESSVRDLIIGEIKGHCEYKTDALGNIIAFKKGKKQPLRRLMVDAHTDEVGLIITGVTEDGFLKFKTVGGINTSALMFRRIRINGKVYGIIGGKPVHLMNPDESGKLPKPETLAIDIGAKTREEALEYVNIGDRAVIVGNYSETDGRIISKAIDDRAGCAILIRLLKQESEYDFYASFSVQEEVGLRGGRTAAYKINPESAIVLDATTAADIAGVESDKRVCALKQGAVVSFMDKATIYDREYYNAAINSGIPCQPKSAVAGGNNSGAIHLSREGVRTLALSVPCRYIHTASSMAYLSDIESVYELTRYMINKICSGGI